MSMSDPLSLFFKKRSLRDEILHQAEEKKWDLLSIFNRLLSVSSCMLIGEIRPLYRIFV